MALKHADIWRAIDRLAENHNLSPSGLALKAGLSSTAFNPSKRASAKRKRWPSTESIAQILQVTNTTLDDFVALATSNGAAPRATLPLLGYAQAGRDGYFDDAGYPTGNGWEEIQFPALADPHAFVLEVSGKSMEPVYREGDRMVVSPAEKPRRGDRVVLRTNQGEVMVRQLGHERAQKIELISLNPDFAPVMLARQDIDWIYRIVWVSQ
jgi:phage repressor protein C with HTH and peptisase S24 domain